MTDSIRIRTPRDVFDEPLDPTMPFGLHECVDRLKNLLMRYELEYFMVPTRDHTPSMKVEAEKMLAMINAYSAGAVAFAAADSAPTRAYKRLTERVEELEAALAEKKEAE